jgi:hypothetical protein
MWSQSMVWHLSNLASLSSLVYDSLFMRVGLSVVSKRQGASEFHVYFTRGFEF